MIGRNSFDPRSGAKVSDKNYYNEEGKQQITVADAFGIDGEEEGEFTTGAIRSTKVALFNHFRRSHQKHKDENEKLYRKAAVALSRLKRAAAGLQHEDIYIWYALYYRLSIRGFSVEWMHSHADIYCPHCHSPLRYNELNDQISGYCISNCQNKNVNQLPQLRETIADLYTEAFKKTISSGEILQFE